MAPKKPQNARDNKQLAYSLFVERGMKQSDVCDILEVAPPQMSKWVKDGNWKELQEAQFASVQIIKASNLQLIYNIQKAIQSENRVAAPKEVDMLLKLASANEKLDKKADLGHYTGIGAEFCQYLKNLPDKEPWQEEAYEAMLNFVSEKAKELSYRH